jgi:hypothetical protein
MLKLLAAGVVVSLSIAATANADGGVVVDPSAPAGKEYAIPLEQARSMDAGSGGVANRRASSAARPSTQQPLFGVGVEKRAPGSVRTSHQSGTRRVTGAASTPAAFALVKRVDQTPVSHTSMTSLSMLAPLALIAAGAALGLGYRRRFR